MYKYRRYLEQEWRKEFLEPILSQEKPFSIQVGTKNPIVFPEAVLAFGGHIGDNQEQHNCLCCKLTGTFFPCRLCWCPKDEMNLAGVDEYIWRSSEDMDTLLTPDILGIFGRSIKYTDKSSRKLIRPLTCDEKEQLKILKENSMLPLRPVFYDLCRPYPGFTAYQLGPPDLLHTLLSRLKTFYFDSIVLCARFESLFPDQCDGNIGILDDMMSKQIISHSMPWKLKNWPSGISQFCKSAVAYGASTLSKGSLGRLDMQEMPALVLQLILCKFLVHNIYVYKTL